MLRRTVVSGTDISTHCSGVKRPVPPPWYTHILSEMNHLALQVAQIHDISIDDTDSTDACRSKVERHGSSENSSFTCTLTISGCNTFCY